MREGLPVMTLTACAVVVTAAFLPWATISGTLTVNSVGGAPVDQADGLARMLAESLGGRSTTFTLTGWQGYAGIEGVQFPNWLVVVAALFVAAFALMERAPNTQVPKALPGAFSVYGLAHLLTLTAAPLSGKGTLGAGFFLAVAAHGVLLFTSLRGAGRDG